MENDERLVCALAGFAAGIVGGLLLAPSSGRKTRRRLGRYLDRSAKAVNKYSQEGSRVVNGLSDTIGRAKDYAADAANRARTLAQDVGKGIARSA